MGHGMRPPCCSAEVVDAPPQGSSSLAAPSGGRAGEMARDDRSLDRGKAGTAEEVEDDEGPLVALGCIR